MKGRINSLQLTAIIGFTVIAVLGGTGYYFASQALQDAQSGLNAQIQKRDQLLRAPIPPSENNIKILSDNNDLLREATAALNARLISPGNKLAEVVQMNPVLFKQNLAAEEKMLSDVAKAQSVHVPPNFAFGFGIYNNITPLDKDTVFLGKQLIGIHELMTALFEAKIDKLLNVRRTFDELSANRASSAGGDAPSEILRGKSVTVGNGIYTVYPFELDFLAKPAALRAFLNKLLDSPYIFVVRSIKVNSTKLDPYHLSDLDRLATSSNGASSAEGTAQNLPPMYAMGFENIEVVVRVDLIEWIGTAKSGPAVAPKSAPDKS